MSGGDFFIGWAETGQADRRFLLGASLGLIAAGGAGAAWLARTHAPAGAGAWAQGAVRTWSGMLMRAPFPMLLTRDIDGGVRTAFVAGYGKVGVQGRLGARADGPVRIRGSLIARGRHAMIAAIDGDDWIGDAPDAPALPTPETRDQGEAVLAGEILDAKCWFGAMRPGDGKVHKACASLCVRGGLPTAFCIGPGCGDSSAAPLLLDETGAPHGPALLPFVADPVRARGRLVSVGDIIQFRAPLSGIERL